MGCWVKNENEIPSLLYGWMKFTKSSFEDANIHRDKTKLAIRNEEIGLMLLQLVDTVKD